MLAKLSEEAFNDKDWIFEIKWDGYRAIADLSHDAPLFYSRNGISFLSKFGKIAQDFGQQRHRMILDGEVVVYNEQESLTFSFYSKLGITPVPPLPIRF